MRLSVGRHKNKTPESPTKTLGNKRINAHMLNYKQIKDQIESKQERLKKMQNNFIEKNKKLVS